MGMPLGRALTVFNNIASDVDIFHVDVGIRDGLGGVSTGEMVCRGLAELIGTLLLVMLGCMGCLGGWSTGPPPPVQYSLSFGIVVMFVIQIFGHISGAHVNPSVTLAALVCREISLPLAGVYLVAQIVGAIGGYGLLLVATPDVALNNATDFCATVPHHDVSSGQAVIVEAFITSILILVTCAVWDPRNKANTDSVPLKFGFTIAGLAMIGGAFTGASMNPARSLAPAIWTNTWDRHWIYWVGPLLGSGISSLLYCQVFRRDPPPTLREEVPLTDIRTKESGTNN